LVVADLKFNTTQANVTLYVKAGFAVTAPGGSSPGGAWNCTSFQAQVVSNQKMTPSAFEWTLPLGQLMAVDWLNSANRTLGKRCSHGEVVLNTKNKLGLDNFHLFPGTKSGQPVNDDSYALCNADMSSGGLGGLAWWVWVLIIVGVLIVLGGVGFGGYTIYQRQHHH